MKKESYFYCVMVDHGDRLSYKSGLAFADKKTSVKVVFDSIKEDIAKSQDCRQDDIVVLAFNRV